MGLTAEPDAVTVTLPPPAPGALAPMPTSRLRSSPGGPGGIDSLSTDTEEEESAGASSSGGGGSSSDGSSSGAQAAPARHVLLVACDGLWDYVTNQEAVEIALRWAEKGRRKGRAMIYCVFCVGLDSRQFGCVVTAVPACFCSPHPLPPCLMHFGPYRYDSAEAAAHALADTARRRWAAAHSGEYVDDVTVAVCFMQ